MSSSKDRRKRICEYMQRRGHVLTSEIADMLGISVAEARRNLRILERNDVVIREILKGEKYRPTHLFRLRKELVTIDFSEAANA